MSNPAAEQAAKKYGLSFTRILPAQKGYRNFSYQIELSAGTNANLIIYKNEPKILAKIKLANEMSDNLAAQGLPVRRAIDSRILAIKAAGSTRYASLYNYLPGHTIAWESYTKKHLKLLGASMAQMHKLLLAFEHKSMPAVEDEYSQILVRIKKYFSEADVSGAMRQKLNLQINLELINLLLVVLEKCKSLPARQPLHMDFVRSNVLFDSLDGELFVSGILDFEKSACGHPLFDICRTLAFLYVDCKYKSTDEVRKHFLQSGYAKHGGGKLTSIKFTNAGRNINLETALVQMFWLHDFYKFLRHNPYESLPDNEHFIRTKQLLLEAGVLAPQASRML